MQNKHSKYAFLTFFILRQMNCNQFLLCFEYYPSEISRPGFIWFNLFLQDMLL